MPLGLVSPIQELANLGELSSSFINNASTFHLGLYGLATDLQRTFFILNGISKKAEKHGQRIQHGKKGRGEQLSYHSS